MTGFFDDLPLLNDRLIHIKMHRRRRVIDRLRVPVCDLCKVERGVERHHIYTKNLTMGNEKARNRANQPEVCALVCQTCHQQKVDSPENRNKLFQQLYRYWGYGTIVAMHNSIDEALRTGVPFNLPEMEVKDGKEEDE